MESTTCREIAFLLLVRAIACDCDAAGGMQLQLLPSRAVWMIMCFHAVLGDRRGCMSLVSLRTSNYLFCMHTQSNPAGLQPARPHGVASAPIWRLRAACRHTHMHTQHRRPARLLHEQKSARTSAASSRPSRMRRPSLEQLRPPHVHLWPARRPPRAAPRRCSPRRRAALSAVRGPMAAAAAAAAAELLGSAPTMVAAADKEPV